MSKSAVVASPVATHDFGKTNGTSSASHMTFCEGPSLTRQEFAVECDINQIMQRYDQYLSDPLRSVREPRYYDFTQAPDTLMGAMEVLKRGEDAFYSLPADVRREFENNPAMFVDFASDPENLPQMRTWGLAAPEKAPDAPMKVEVVGPVAPVSSSPVVTPGG